MKKRLAIAGRFFIAQSVRSHWACTMGFEKNFIPGNPVFAGAPGFFIQKRAQFVAGRFRGNAYNDGTHKKGGRHETPGGDF